MTLRPYQEDLLQRTFAALRGQSTEDTPLTWSGPGAHPLSVLVQMATGGGKTHTAAELVRRVLAGQLADLLPPILGQERRIQFWADLREINADTVARFTAAGLDVGVIAAGHPAHPNRPVQVVQVQTVCRRGLAGVPRADLLILDEAHISEAKDLQATLRQADPVILIGLTATPSRGDGQGLGNTFARLVQGPSTAELTQAGYLVPCEVIAPSSGYLERGLAMDPVSAYLRYYLGRGRQPRALVFCADRMAGKVASDFENAGVAAEVLAADTKPKIRATQRARLASGALRVLCTVDCAIKGWDCPAVDTVILARGVSVPGIYLQMIGRALRPSPGKDRARLIDLRGNVYLHGLPDEDRVWTLDGEAVRLRDETVAYARCVACGWLGLYRRGSCPRCGKDLGKPVKPPRVARAQQMERVQALPMEERRRRYELALQRRARIVGRRVPAHAFPAWAAGFVRRELEKWERRNGVGA